MLENLSRGYRADRKDFKCLKKNEYSFYWIFPSKSGCKDKCGVDHIKSDCSCKYSCLRQGDCCDDFEKECKDELLKENCKLCKKCVDGRCARCKVNSEPLVNDEGVCSCKIGYEYDALSDECVKKEKEDINCNDNQEMNENQFNQQSNKSLKNKNKNLKTCISNSTNVKNQTITIITNTTTNNTKNTTSTSNSSCTANSNTTNTNRTNTKINNATDDSKNTNSTNANNIFNSNSTYCNYNSSQIDKNGINYNNTSREKNETNNENQSVINVDKSNHTKSTNNTFIRNNSIVITDHSKNSTCSDNFINNNKTNLDNETKPHQPKDNTIINNTYISVNNSNIKISNDIKCQNTTNNFPSINKNLAEELLKSFKNVFSMQNPQNKNQILNLYMNGNISINVLTGNTNPQMITQNIYNKDSYNKLSHDIKNIHSGNHMINFPKNTTTTLRFKENQKNLSKREKYINIKAPYIEQKQII